MGQDTKHTKCRLINDNTVLEITTKLKDPVNMIFVDLYKNSENYTSNDASKHSFAFIVNDMLGIAKYTKTEIKYYLNCINFGLDKFSDMYIVTCELGPNVNESAIVYNSNMLYCFRLKLMDNICVPCTDAKNFALLETLMFRELMFREAVSLGRIEDAVKFYGKILSMQGHTTTNTGCGGNCGSCSCNR
ncbi:hypothetical protein AGMMS50239_36710 [Bacteroidia bacterium]|nr:hypothetical protein AGMMS50239_36710 [Bacteroidia bacterium]